MMSFCGILLGTWTHDMILVSVLSSIVLEIGPFLLLKIITVKVLGGKVVSYAARLNSG